MSKAVISDLLSSTSPLVEFTLFPKLPIELRQKVWRHAFPPPRVVLISLYHGLVTPPSITTLPTLWVNHESRSETLRDYGIMECTIPTSRTPVLVIGKKDTPKLMGRELVDDASGLLQLLANVRSHVPGGLAVFKTLEITSLPFVEVWTSEPEVIGMTKSLLRQFTGLKNLNVSVELIGDERIWEAELRGIFEEEYATKALAVPKIKARVQTLLEQSEEVTWMESRLAHQRVHLLHDSSMVDVLVGMLVDRLLRLAREAADNARRVADTARGVADVAQTAMDAAQTIMDDSDAQSVVDDALGVTNDAQRVVNDSTDRGSESGDYKPLFDDLPGRSTGGRMMRRLARKIFGGILH